MFFMLSPLTLDNCNLYPLYFTFIVHDGAISILSFCKTPGSYNCEHSGRREQKANIYKNPTKIQSIYDIFVREVLT